MTKTQKNIAKRWIAALRSGDYKKGTGALRTRATGSGKDQYCCLGVLCELAVKAKVIDAPTTDGGSGTTYEYDGERGLLPPSVQEWAGLHSNDGAAAALTKNGNEVSLTDVNDGTIGGQRSFREIADLIEKHLNGKAPKGTAPLFV